MFNFTPILYIMASSAPEVAPRIALLLRFSVQK